MLHPQTGQQYELVQQKGVDVGLAFHLMRSYARRGWNKLFLGAGDGDFHEVVQYFVEGENIPVWLIGTMNSISEELRPMRPASFSWIRSRWRSPAPGRLARASNRDQDRPHS